MRKLSESGLQPRWSHSGPKMEHHIIAVLRSSPPPLRRVRLQSIQRYGERRELPTGVCGGTQPKSNSVHLSYQIWRVERTIFVSFFCNKHINYVWQNGDKRDVNE